MDETTKNSANEATKKAADETTNNSADEANKRAEVESSHTQLLEEFKKCCAYAQIACPRL